MDKNKKHLNSEIDVFEKIFKLSKEILTYQDLLISLFSISDFDFKVQYRWKKYELSDFEIPRKQTKWKKYNLELFEIPKVQYKWKIYDLHSFEIPKSQKHLSYPKLPENYILTDYTKYKHIRYEIHSLYSDYYNLITNYIYSEKRKPYILISETVGLNEFITYLWEDIYDIHNGSRDLLLLNLYNAYNSMFADLADKYKTNFEERFDRLERRMK